MPENSNLEHRECASCFLVEEIQVPNGSRKATVPLCDYCRENSPVKKQLLERQLEVMPRSEARRLPHILRLMYGVLKKEPKKAEGEIE